MRQSHLTEIERLVQLFLFKQFVSQEQCLDRAREVVEKYGSGTLLHKVEALDAYLQKFIIRLIDSVPLRVWVQIAPERLICRLFDLVNARLLRWLILLRHYDLVKAYLFILKGDRIVGLFLLEFDELFGL